MTDDVKIEVFDSRFTGTEQKPIGYLDPNTFEFVAVEGNEDLYHNEPKKVYLSPTRKV